MNATTIRRVTVAAVAAATLALASTACNSGSTPSAAPTSAAAGSSAAPAAPGGAAPSGTSSVSLDGKALTGNFETTCAKTGGTIALSIDDAANSAYGNLAVSATVDGTTVTAVAIAGTKGGANGVPLAVGYGKGAPGGSAKVSVTGKTYHVTGEGVGTPDLTNPTAVKTDAFDITFACTDIVGG
ncbi:lipoprotein LpqH [Nocardia stercoris]|uniref:Lipoprotein LpqH n=1 Tax=Nocardia stercoris TaxID=2483361 RepID=A0A3M2LAE0_9NOCA|nr:lipoprotein LpqH [Nocardia stercoris]RMI33996.1 hypothetical protein EBN03_05950 [Nocardia stercoris]